MIRIIAISKSEFDLFTDMLPKNYEYGRANEYLLGALTEDGTACGILHYKFDENRYEVLFLGVHPVFRRQGIGTELMRSFLDSAYGDGILYPVHITYEERRENYAFEKMLKSMGCFYIENGSGLFCVTGRDRRASERYQELLTIKDKSVPFFSLPASIRNRFLKDQREMGFPYLDDLETRRDDFCEELCRCLLFKDKIVTAVFITIDEKANLTMDYAYSEDPTGKALVNVLSGVAKVVEKDYTIMKLFINPINDMGYSIFNKIFGGSSDRINIMEAEWDYS